MRFSRPTLFSFLPATRRQVLELKHIILNAQELFMANQAQIAAGLVAASAALTKIGQETSTTLQKVAALEEQIANGNVSPELQTAFDDLKAQLQRVDDLVPDVVPTPENPTPETPVDPDAPVEQITGQEPL